MATLSELQAELAEVRTAKRDLLQGGQEYGLGDRRFKGVSYNDLLARERQLVRAIKFASGDGNAVLNVFAADLSRSD